MKKSKIQRVSPLIKSAIKGMISSLDKSVQSDQVFMDSARMKSPIGGEHIEHSIIAESAMLDQLELELVTLASCPENLIYEYLNIAPPCVGLALDRVLGRIQFNIRKHRTLGLTDHPLLKFGKLYEDRQLELLSHCTLYVNN